MDSSTQLIQLFAEGINNLQQFEMHCQKIYRSLSKNAFVPELAKALDEEQTGIKHHIKRLNLIATMLPKQKIKTALLFPKAGRVGKTKSLLKDLEIIDEALQLQQLKTVRYDYLKSLAVATRNEHAPELLEQCIAENQATTTWITRTFHQSLSKIESEEQQGSSVS